MKIISVIPARGQSKSIHLKNISILNRKPLIYYSIKQSLKCKLIQRTIVSTDNEQIKMVYSIKNNINHEKHIEYFRKIIIERKQYVITQDNKFFEGDDIENLFIIPTVDFKKLWPLTTIDQRKNI